MQMTLEKASRTDLMRAFNQLSTQKIIEVGYPGISILRRGYGTEKVEKVLEVLIVDLSLAFDAELGDQAEELAVEISTRWGSLTLEDVYVCFGDVKKGKHFGKLTQNKVLNALEKQHNNRINASDDYNYNRHLAQKERPGERNNTAERMLNIAAKTRYLHEKAKGESEEI